ncbi:MAG: hypothetical protein H0V02_06855 [Nocardioidaceae bacterium]|nr:hypothetical protein [Nocardioidaceae bacterium]
MYRSHRDELGEHDRQFLQPDVVTTGLENYGVGVEHCENRQGLAVHNDEDPRICRIVAKIEVNMTEEDKGAQPQGRRGKLRKGKGVSGAGGQSGQTSGRSDPAGGGQGRPGLKKLRGRVAKLETEMQELRDRLKDRESKA